MWLIITDLTSRTVRRTVIMAAQQQTLSTRAIEAGVYQTRPKMLAVQTVQHIKAGCEMKAGRPKPSVYNSIVENGSARFGWMVETRVQPSQGHGKVNSK